MEEIYSIGVDIGTSTTNMVLSKLQINTRVGASLQPETTIGETQIIYRSPIIFTPVKEEQIDFIPIKALIEEGVRHCKIKKEDIETGAVIITGETARKDNAARVGQYLSDYLGEFVVACAGPQLESVLAGQGAGAAKISKERSKRVLNLDIGGGTLNGAVFYCGELESAYAMDIGGRLVTYDSQRRITYLSERIAFLVKQYELPLEIGKVAKEEHLRQLCGYLAEYCIQSCGLRPMQQEARQLLISNYSQPDSVDYLMVSGGVGECMNNVGEVWRFGDMGPLLAQSLGEKLKDYPQLYLDCQEGIRATVIGAGNHSISVSGSTIGAQQEVLPVKNLLIVKSTLSPENWGSLREELEQVFPMYEGQEVAVAIRGEKSPSYKKLKVLAAQIGELFQERGQPIYILLKEDYGKALSQLLHIYGQPKQPVVCLDGIDVSQGDYVDIGKPIGSAVPVVIKTLIYKS